MREGQAVILETRGSRRVVGVERVTPRQVVVDGGKRFWIADGSAVGYSTSRARNCAPTIREPLDGEIEEIERIETETEAWAENSARDTKEHLRGRMLGFARAAEEGVDEYLRLMGKRADPMAISLRENLWHAKWALESAERDVRSCLDSIAQNIEDFREHLLHDRSSECTTHAQAMSDLGRYEAIRVARREQTHHAVRMIATFLGVKFKELVAEWAVSNEEDAV